MYHTNAAVDFTMDPAYISCGFEQAIISAVKHQFPRSKVIGYLFHFKQALRRKMLKEGISESEVGIAMQDGAIDELTTVRPSEIIRSGIRNVKTTIMEECQDQNIPYSTEQWSKFWKYFVRTWIKQYKPEDWNVYGIQDIVNRTNNPLERYNRTLNRAMGELHPDIGFAHLSCAPPAHTPPPRRSTRRTTTSVESSHNVPTIVGPIIVHVHYYMDGHPVDDFYD
ncbi:hypothetical protein PR001_g28909 [Phytophthora rubi]|uniref:MULE transposase domain-containing protein n=1 Tax=Phytophthora rubi TaxID=129364 RepID=A0A6A3H7V9_9STRA|nr:hypothetical protein PR001_g28909 [Phytophthora rubi]